MRIRIQSELKNIENITWAKLAKHGLTGQLRLTAASLLIAVGLFAASAFGQSGPVGYWTFDSSTITGIQVGDSSGNNLNGNMVGGVTSCTGVINQALSFNGVSGYIAYPNDKLTDLTNNVTLALWVKTLNNSRTEALISRYNASGYEYGYLLRDNPTGHLELRIGANNGVWGTLTDSGKAINDGQWHHVAVVITLGQGVTFYVDGNVNSQASANVTANPSQSNLMIGLNSWTPYGTYFTGSMDDVRIYNRALAAAEVSTLASSQSATTAVAAPPASEAVPALAVSASTLSFNATAGSSNPAARTVNISNSANGTLGSWTVSWSSSASWLSVTPASGSGAETISANASISGLAAGTYSGSVTITAPGASPSSQTINVSLVVAPEAVAPVVTGTGPVGYWTFDSSTITGIQVGDSSGNNLNGNMVGGVTSCTGVINQALSFNGISGYIAYPNDKLTDLTNNVTLALWVKTLNNSRTEALISRYNASGYEYGYLLRDNPTGHLELRIGANNGVWGTLTDSGKAINDGQWHHVAVVITLGQGVTFYVDGNVNSQASANVTANPSQSNLMIGLNSWTPYGTYFTGSMDDVRIYNRALAAAEVSTLASSQSAPAISSATPAAPAPVATPGVVSANPTSVSFGNLNVGTSSSKTVILTNSGNANVTISQITAAGVTVSGVSTPMTLTAGQSTVLSIAYAPASSTVLASSVTIVSNAPNSPLTIAVTGAGVQPQLSANPSSYNFGSVNVGSIGNRVITLSNSGNSSLTISQVSFSGTGYSLSGLATPLTIGAGQSLSFNVQFAPQTAGSLPGSITLSSNSPNSPTTIVLAGTGVGQVAYSVYLSWSASANAITYNVYFGTVSGGPYTKLTTAPVAATNYTVTNVQPSQTYYYVVTAVNASGVESSYSSEVSVVVP